MAALHFGQCTRTSAAHFRLAAPCIQRHDLSPFSETRAKQDRLFVQFLYQPHYIPLKGYTAQSFPLLPNKSNNKSKLESPLCLAYNASCKDALTVLLSKVLQARPPWCTVIAHHADANYALIFIQLLQRLTILCPGPHPCGCISPGRAAWPAPPPVDHPPWAPQTCSTCSAPAHQSPHWPESTSGNVSLTFHHSVKEYVTPLSPGTESIGEKVSRLGVGA